MIVIPSTPPFSELTKKRGREHSTYFLATVLFNREVYSALMYRKISSLTCCIGRSFKVGGQLNQSTSVMRIVKVPLRKDLTGSSAP